MCSLKDKDFICPQKARQIRAIKNVVPISLREKGLIRTKIFTASEFVKILCSLAGIAQLVER